MYLKQGDTAPAFTADLNADITGATTKSVRFSKLDGTFVMARTLTVVDAPTGVVSYQWVAPGDNALIATTGAYRADIMVTFASGVIERFPQRSYLEVIVKAAVPAA